MDESKRTRHVFMNMIMSTLHLRGWTTELTKAAVPLDVSQCFAWSNIGHL